MNIILNQDQNVAHALLFLEFLDAEKEGENAISRMLDLRGIVPQH
jgi:hypothetical protein